MQLFFDAHATMGTFALCEEESMHIHRVLRKKEGDLVHVSNGNGSIFTCEIIEINKKQCVLSAQSKKDIPAPNKQVHIAIGLTKNIDRFEWFIEKATEIGVLEFTPLVSARSERKKVHNFDRIEKLMVSAMKQSLSAYKPVLNSICTFEELLKKQTDAHKLIAHCLETDKDALKDFAFKYKAVQILIGPEGDFTEQEIQRAIQQGYTPISLGNKRLRTETAGLVAATYLCAQQ